MIAVFGARIILSTKKCWALFRIYRDLTPQNQVVIITIFRVPCILRLEDSVKVNIYNFHNKTLSKIFLQIDAGITLDLEMQILRVIRYESSFARTLPE